MRPTVGVWGSRFKSVRGWAVAMQLQAVARSLPRAAMGCRLPAYECVRCSGSAHMEQVSSRETRAAGNTPRIADG